MGWPCCARSRISIHALREEGDVPGMILKTGELYFYPRPPRGGRRRRTKPESKQSGFLSTPSARRATEIDGQKANAYYISIHALREEGD